MKEKVAKPGSGRVAEIGRSGTEDLLCVKGPLTDFLFEVLHCAHRQV